MARIPHIGGNHGVVRFGGLRCWADRGLVHIEDEANTYEAISVHECLERMNAISDMVTNTLQDRDLMNKLKGRLFKALEDNQDFLNEMMVVVQKAREQGMPTDPTARREYARRRPTTLLMPKLPSF